MVESALTLREQRKERCRSSKESGAGLRCAQATKPVDAQKFVGDEPEIRRELQGQNLLLQADGFRQPRLSMIASTRSGRVALAVTQKIRAQLVKATAACAQICASRNRIDLPAVKRGEGASNVFLPADF